jgi:hypothetical protein
VQVPLVLVLALAMIYAILMLVVIFYMKLCVDLIVGVRKVGPNYILNCDLISFFF